MPLYNRLFTLSPCHDIAPKGRGQVAGGDRREPPESVGRIGRALKGRRRNRVGLRAVDCVDSSRGLGRTIGAFAMGWGAYVLPGLSVVGTTATGGSFVTPGYLPASLRDYGQARRCPGAASKTAGTPAPPQNPQMRRRPNRAGPASEKGGCACGRVLRGNEDVVL